MQHRTKRVRYSEAKVRRLLLKQQNKAISVAEFCQSHQISKATFYNWRKKYRALDPIGANDEHQGFIPLRFEHQSSAEPGLFAEVRLSSEFTVKLYQRVEASYFKELL